MRFNGLRWPLLLFVSIAAACGADNGNPKFVPAWDWRSTTAPQWTQSRPAGDAVTLTLRGINIDDSLFGVSAVSADGFASPVVFPGPSGSFQTQATK